MVVELSIYTKIIKYTLLIYVSFKEVNHQFSGEGQRTVPLVARWPQSRDDEDKGSPFQKWS